MLLNLLNNAIKFSEEGKVLLEVLQTGEQDGEVHLSFFVHDTGIGMSEEAQTKLFQILLPKLIHRRRESMEGRVWDWLSAASSLS